MTKPKHTSKPRLGRPPIGIVRRGISLGPADVETFRTLGAGCISAGVRLAAQIIRKTTKGA